MFDKYFVHSLWKYKLLNNTIKDYFLALVSLLLLFLLLELIHKIIIGRLEKFASKTKNKLDDFIVMLFKKLGPPAYMWISFWTAINMLDLPKASNRIIGLIMIVWGVGIIINIVEKIVNYLIGKHLGKDSQAKSFIYIISLLTKIMLWVFGGFIIISNTGIDFSSALTGLGVSGIIVAFAMQNVLSDLFSSFTIYLDKPFKVGDYVTVGTEAGFVKKIGIKTTRIEGPTGQIIIISNKDLTNARIQNFEKLNERQTKFQLHLTLDTTPDNLLKATNITKEVIESQPNVNFDRSHIIAVTDHSMLLETAYIINGSDYKLFLDCQQAILLEVRRRFDKANIKLAIPTQKILS